MAEERLWCTACGTVTRDQTCDCNRWQNEMSREPQFVNYADAMQETAHEQSQQIDALVKAMEKVRSYNVDIAAGRINYRPHDHIQVIDEALAAVGNIA
jgi:LmbE family N-acetylglucosaminyl deacetylase